MRGVNNVGSRRVTMAALKAAFEGLGFENVRTVLASGNVIFESTRRDPHVDRTIERGLEAALGFPVSVVLRTVRELKAIVGSKPFKASPSDRNIQLYVTFLSRKGTPRSQVPLPVPPNEVRIVRADPGEIYSAVMLSRGGRTPDLMRYLDRTLGRSGTTRNWRTVLKLAGSKP